MNALHITREKFEQEVLKSEIPVLLDFWAPWCGPCKMLVPIIDELASEVSDFKVGKVNVDEEGDLAMQYGVQSIPTLVVIKNGEVVNKAVGFQAKDKVLELVRR